MALIGTMKYLTIGNNTYEIAGGDLPIASASTLGGIKVGTGLTIDSSTGVLNATGTSITIDTTMSDSSTNAVQNKVIKGYVDSAITALPEPMIFKGSLGTGGTITTLPAASSSNEGFTYKVITAGTYASQSAKIGDTFISDGSSWILIPSGDEPSGTVTSVGVSNATNGGLTISGSPITSSGSITVGHSNVLTSAQTTEAVYPIKIDKNGHISSYGSAVTIPTVPSSTGSGTTGISIADHSTTTIYGVSSSTTSVTGVDGSTSIYGVKSGTNSTTTASHVVSGGNGSAPTLGTAITVRGVKTGTNSTTTASKASGGNGSASSWTFEEKSIPNVTSAGSASSWTFEEKSIPNVTAAGSGSASLTFTMDTTDTKKLKITFSHTHTAPTLGTAIKVQSKSGGSNGSAPTLGTAIKVQSKSGGSNGSAPTWSFTDVTVPIRADSDTSIPNVTSVGSASNWTFEDITVPIRSDSATTVPITASSATTVPVKNSTATTVVTSKTHSVTDNGHTHTI